MAALRRPFVAVLLVGATSQVAGWDSDLHARALSDCLRSTSVPEQSQDPDVALACVLQRVCPPNTSPATLFDFVCAQLRPIIAQAIHQGVHRRRQTTLMYGMVTASCKLTRLQVGRTEAARR